MARAVARRRSASPTVPVAVLAGFGPLAYFVISGAKSDGINGALFELTRRTTGWNLQAGTMEWPALVSGMGPVFAGFGVHWLANRFGINRALARARVPFLRL